jgi:uncharacterized protein (TIRG00374 family)
MVRWRSVLIGGAISAVCLVLLIRTVDLGETRRSFERADPLWLVVAFALLAASLVLRCWRWQLLFLPENRVTLWGTICSTLVGYMFNTVLPGRVGELVRASLISQTDHVSTARALGTIVVEKILDVLVLLVILGVLTTLMPLPAWVTAAGVSATITFGAIAVAFFALTSVRRWFVSFLERHVDPLPLVHRFRPSHLADSLLGAAGALRRPRLALAQATLSIVLWSTAVLTAAAVLEAFHLSVPLAATTLVVVTTNLGMTVPSAPGYIGVYHYIAVLTLALFGVEAAPALSFAVTLHALAFGSFTLGGAAVLVAGLAQQRYRLNDLWRWRAAPVAGYR